MRPRESRSARARPGTAVGLARKSGENTMATLQERLAELVPEWRAERAKLLKEKGANKIADCTVAQAFGGMRGIKGMICDTSVVEPDKGLIIRGNPLLDIQELWPEQTFILLLTGEIQKLYGQAMDRVAELKKG